MLDRFGHFLYRRRRRVLLGTLAGILIAGAVGGNVAKYLSTGGFDEPDSESVRAERILGEEFGQAPPNLILLVTAKNGTVDDPAVRRAGVELTNSLLRENGVSQVISHWALGPQSPLASKDRTKAIILAQVEGDDETSNETSERLIPRYESADSDVVEVSVGGFEAIFREISTTIEKDLARGEGIAIPITLVLLIIVFGSVIAAAMPLAIGIISIIGTFFVLRIIALMTDVSMFALSMVTAMGLGLAIDYSLFIVSRFREEVRKGADTETAVVTTVRTAGRTIIFSGITVAVSLAALMVFPVAFFRSFGYAGIGVVATAVVGAVVFLPAALAALGPNVDRWRLWRRRPKDVGEGFWHRLAVFVMRRPVTVAVSVTLVLLALGIPFLHVRFGLPDERVLPPGAATRQVHDTLRRDFPSDEVQSIRVVAPDTGNPVSRKDEITDYARSLSSMAGVRRVESMSGEHVKGQLTRGQSALSARYASADGTWFQVVLAVDPFSERAEDIAQTIRQGEAPFDVLVGGAPGQLIDVKESLFSRLPLAVGIIAVITFVLLFLMFGSLLVPAKALVLNMLSLTATFGAMVWVFQDGHLSGLLDFTATGTLDLTSPILIFCIAFGLSMDYEVFLLSRIKEEYDATGDNERSVAIGLERTGRIVTAAAVLISVVFLAIGSSSVRFIKLFGIGMSLAVLMDAFVIRGTLVPAFMRLAGRANWWLPKWLQPLHARVHIREIHELGSERPEPPRPKATRPARKAAARKPAAPRRKPAARKKTTAKKKPAVRSGTPPRTPGRKKAPRR